LNVSGLNVLEWLICDQNQLTAAALNALFQSLHSNTISGGNSSGGNDPFGSSGEKVVEIQNNPGEATCDRSIATSKGWTVKPSATPEEPEYVVFTYTFNGTAMALNTNDGISMVFTYTPASLGFPVGTYLSAWEAEGTTSYENGEVVVFYVQYRMVLNSDLTFEISVRIAENASGAIPTEWEIAMSGTYTITESTLTLIVENGGSSSSDPSNPDNGEKKSLKAAVGSNGIGKAITKSAPKLRGSKPAVKQQRIAPIAK